MSYQDVIEVSANFIEELPVNSSLVIGLSGGIDSVVLTHALSFCISQHKKKIKLTCVHVNHGLQADADSWQNFTSNFSHSLSIPFKAILINIETKNRQGLESAARNKRYKALYSHCPAGSYLLTAHHKQDQVESVLLNIFRGTGTKGLAGMPSAKFINNSIIHARPFLSVNVNDIVDYAKHYDLAWVEDLSNEDCSFKRNYLRHKVLPLVKHGWAGVENNICRMANILADDLLLLNDLAQQDLKFCKYTKLSLTLNNCHSLSWNRKKNIIRFWVSEVARFKVRLTSEMFNWIECSLKITNINAHPSKIGKSYQFRIEKQTIFLLNIIENQYSINLDDFNPLEFGFDELIISDRIKFLKKTGKFNVRNISKDELTDKQLKKWFKQQKIVFWNRSRWPVVFDKNSIEIIGFNV